MPLKFSPPNFYPSPISLKRVRDVIVSIHGEAQIVLNVSRLLPLTRPLWVRGRRRLTFQTEAQMIRQQVRGLLRASNRIR